MNVCHAYFDRHLIDDSYASRKGKGVYAAVEQAKTYTYQHHFYLKLDVRKFFDSIHHDVLKNQLRRFCFATKNCCLFLTKLLILMPQRLNAVCQSEI